MADLVRNRDLKTRVRFSTSIDIDLNNKLEELSKTTRIPKSKLLDEAIELLLSHHKQ